MYPHRPPGGDRGWPLDEPPETEAIPEPRRDALWKWRQKLRAMRSRVGRLCFVSPLRGPEPADNPARAIPSTPKSAGGGSYFSSSGQTAEMRGQKRQP